MPIYTWITTYRQLFGSINKKHSVNIDNRQQEKNRHTYIFIENLMPSGWMDHIYVMHNAYPTIIKCVTDRFRLNSIKILVYIVSLTCN